MSDPLAFMELRDANVRRCEQAFHPIGDWSETDWACAAAGEVGEMCNLVKKRRRGEQIPVEEVAKEAADAIIYLDLLAAAMGFDLAAAVRDKFNAVSVLVKSDIILAVQETWTCLYCGMQYLSGTALDVHNHVCEQHPLPTALREVSRLRALLDSE